MASEQTFYFYDLETSGVNPRDSRIMQFAGQRTNMQLEPIGEPDNILISVTPDILPEPDAILITGITPQQTLLDGISEASFLHYFSEHIALPGTIFVGFNSVRFDDEFMRFLHYRNFYDPYEWHYKDDKSRWDMLDVVRITRALRPDGIDWPVADDGSATNRLELLTKANGLLHESAHDALSDVRATIAVAAMILEKQPKLFSYLLHLRDKRAVAEFVSANQLFLYTSGRYSGEFEKTTVVCALSETPHKQGVLVYDLRHDPAEYLSKTVNELVDLLTPDYTNKDKKKLPVKQLQFNKCPALAPMSVLDSATKARLHIDTAQLQRYYSQLHDSDFAERVAQAFDIIENGRQAQFIAVEQPVDAQLYDGFVQDPRDKTQMSVIRAADQRELETLHPTFSDKRLRELFPLYKARNYPALLSDDERQIWEAYCTKRLTSGDVKSKLAVYMQRLQDVAKTASPEQMFLLEELHLYAESLLP